MTENVSFEIAKLLKEKGWDTPTLNFYFEGGDFKENWNDELLTKKNGDRSFGGNKPSGYFETFSAPTIAEVVMRLYEKYGIWIHVMMSFKEFTPYIQCDWNYRQDAIKVVLKFMEMGKRFNSPTEAYSEAILYTLKNLI